MAKKKPEPKSDVGRTLDVPHEELYNVMHRFLRDVVKAERDYREEVEALRTKLRVPAVYHETVDVERCSLAVQVFAAMTIEAAISFAAVLQFGGEHHDSHFRWGSAEARLRDVLRFGGRELSADHEIMRIIQRVFEGRHRIVHPHSAEYVASHETTQRLPNRPRPDTSAAGARQAVADVDRFFALLRELSQDYSHHFYV